MSLEGLNHRLALPALLLLSVLAMAPPASADVGETIILRCTHGQSLAGFTQSAYGKALKELSADSEEYSNCASLIRQAQLAAASAGHGSSSGPSGESSAPLAATPAEQQAIARAGKVSPPSVRLGSALVQPGVVHVSIASAVSSLPGPLLATLAFLLAALALAGGAALRQRLRGKRTD